MLGPADIKRRMELGMRLLKQIRETADVACELMEEPEMEEDETEKEEDSEMRMESEIMKPSLEIMMARRGNSSSGHMKNRFEIYTSPEGKGM